MLSQHPTRFELKVHAILRACPRQCEWSIPNFSVRAESQRLSRLLPFRSRSSEGLRSKIQDMQGQLSIARRAVADEAPLILKWLQLSGFMETEKTFELERAANKLEEDPSDRLNAVQAERPIILESRAPFSVTLVPQPPNNLPSASIEIVKDEENGDDQFASPPGFESPPSTARKRKREKGGNRDDSSDSSSSSGSDSDESGSGEKEDEVGRNDETESQANGGSLHEQEGEDDVQEPRAKKRGLEADRKITWVDPNKPDLEAKEVPLASKANKDASATKDTERRVSKTLVKENGEEARNGRPKHDKEGPISSKGRGLKTSVHRPKFTTLCRFFARGACAKGDQCEWSHNVAHKSSPNTEKELLEPLSRKRSGQRRPEVELERGRNSLPGPPIMMDRRPSNPNGRWPDDLPPRERSFEEGRELGLKEARYREEGKRLMNPREMLVKGPPRVDLMPHLVDPRDMLVQGPPRSRPGRGGYY